MTSNGTAAHSAQGTEWDSKWIKHDRAADGCGKCPSTRMLEVGSALGTLAELLEDYEELRGSAQLHYPTQYARTNLDNHLPGIRALLSILAESATQQGFRSRCTDPAECDDCRPVAIALAKLGARHE